MPANPLGGSRASPREAVLDLVATWGAPADPAVASLIAALPRRFNPAQVLALVREKTRDVLPAALRDEMDRASDVLQAGGTAQAPSFRARLAALLDQAGEALEAALLKERSELATLLAGRWEELGDEPIADILGALWAGTEESSITGRVAGLERIRSAKTALRTAPAGADRAPAGRPGPAGRAAAAAPQAEAVEKRFAAIVDAVRRTVEASRSAGAVGTAESRLLTALARIQPGLKAAGEPDTASLFDLYEKEILPDQGTQAERARRQAEGRTAFVSTLAAMAKDVAAQGEVTTITDRAREQAAMGGSPYYEAIRAAAERLVAIRLKSATALEASAATLRNAARDLETTLPKIAAHLPTQQVVESRLLLEQAAGVLQAGRREEIDAHAEAVRRRVEEVHQVSEARRASSKERGERDRQTLAAAIRSLAEVAPRGAAGRLARLEAGLSRGKGSNPEAARTEFDRIARDIEQAIRLAAARRLSAARGWLKGRGTGADGADSPAAGLATACDSLAGSLGGDDLSGIRDRSDEVRTLLSRASLWQRPAVRGAAAAVGALLLVGAFAGWTLFQNRAHTIRVQLPPGWTTVWMVHDGHLVEERKSGGNAEPEFRLAPGTYEIYVDNKYTGRRFTVPGETVIKDVVPTHVPASGGPTGAGDESTAHR